MNIPGTSASIGAHGVAVDAVGNVFIADIVDNIVLRLDIKTGVLSLVAGNGTFGFSGDGGPATSAELYFPNGVAVDSSGNLYITDTYNNRVRKVSGGVITTAAGTGAVGYGYGSGGFSRAFTCSRSSPSNHSMMSSILAPASRLSRVADTGIRVPLRTHAP